jgi:uncharacterized protein YqiB (DUF1249 family)
MNLLRERYRLDLVELQATCAANYLRLLRLLPQLREWSSGGEHLGIRRVALTQGEQVLGVLAFEVLEICPYTTTLMLRQEQSLPWLPVPPLQVRVYHDARMAEVIGAANVRGFRSTYLYPNSAMHQPDEKTQLNQFLGEWLRHCLACGHELQPVI